MLFLSGASAWIIVWTFWDLRHCFDLLFILSQIKLWNSHIIKCDFQQTLADGLFLWGDPLDIQSALLINLCHNCPKHFDLKAEETSSVL